MSATRLASEPLSEAVQVAPVRHVARMVQEAEAVDDGHGQHRAAKLHQRRVPEDAADDLDTLDLVAMDGA